MSCWFRHEWDESNGWRYCRLCDASQYLAANGQWADPDEGEFLAERIGKALTRLFRI